MNYKQIAEKLEAFTLPQKPTLAELNELVAFLYPLFLKPYPDSSKNRDEWSCYWNASQLFQQILGDEHHHYKSDIKNNLLIALEQKVSLTEFLNRYTVVEKTPVSDNAEDVLLQIYEEFGYKNVVHIPYDEEQIFKLLVPYFNWLEKQLAANPYAHFKIIWDVLHSSQHVIRKAFFKWFNHLETQQLVEKNFNVHILQAEQWERFYNDAHFTEKTTKANFYHWIDLLDHQNPVLRGIAAKCIGGVYTDWQDEENEFQGQQHIPISEMLHLLYQKQVAGKNVVGGFISGCCTNLHLEDLEKHKILVEQDFDVKAWIVKTVIDSPEQEPYIPGSQAFWFYVHEYLDFDPKSLHKLIDGKRYWLALMCATESLQHSFEQMKPILERLQKEAPESTAAETKRQVQIYFEMEKKKKK